MSGRWSTVGALFVGIGLGLAMGLGGILRSTEAKESPAVESRKLGELQAEMQAIKDRLPDQAHAMQDVGGQFANLWMAEQRRNWVLANFFWGETRSHLRWAVRIIPKRKDHAGREVDLVSILQALENGPLARLQAAIEAKDHDRFVAAYKFTMENCYACHKASDKPYLRPHIPTVPATQILNFDPGAKWPL